MARDDIADIAYVNPGYQPGRFPVIATGEMPFMFGDGKRAPRRSTPGIANTPPQEMKDTHFCFAFIHDPGAPAFPPRRSSLPADSRA